MAKLNLLNGNIQGKLGETYGYRRKQDNILSAVPFSHAPHNDAQKQSFTAFAQAQKLYGSIARIFFDYTNLEDKRLNKINAVAKYFKGLIENHSYVPNNITKILPQNDTMQLVTVNYNGDTSVLSIGIDNITQSVRGLKDRLYLGVFALNGVLLDEYTKELQQGANVINLTITNLLEYQIIAFKSVATLKGWRMCCPIYFAKEQLVIDGILYINKVPYIKDVAVNDGVLSFTLPSASVTDEILNLD